jgi:beta-N-acetylhexosaminidase
MAYSSGGAGNGRQARSAYLMPSLAVAVALALIVLGLDLLIPEPIVFTWRPAVVAALATFGVMAAMIALFAGRRWIAVLFAAGALLALWQGGQDRIARWRVLGRNTPDGVDVARHFVVGYGDLAVVSELVRNARVGGIFLTQRNVAGRSAADVAAEIAGLQAIRRDAGLPPLVVTADQEGGPVAHLSPPLPHPPALSSIAALPSGDRSEAAARIGREQGQALKMIGVTMDLAPVVDLMPARATSALDWNTHIATRSISSDPAVVAVIATSFSQGLLSAGITPTAKHFPGLGRVGVDTHLFGTSLDAAATDLQARDWVPFRAVLGVPGAAVMLSHVALDSADKGVPASRSKPVVDGLLRQQWGFDGVAITDDLTMGAVLHAGFCGGVEGALNAGIDLLLVSWETDKIYPALQCALAALDAGRLDRDMLQRSAQRLDRLEKAKAVAVERQ